MSLSFYNNRYVPLHNHSSFSLLDGLCRHDQIIKVVTEYGSGAVAVTDHGNMSGAYKFWKACQGTDIKPIIGQEFYIVNPDIALDGSWVDASVSKEKTGNVTNHHLVLLAYNQQGYQNLCRLSSWGYIYGHYYKPRIDLIRLKQYNEGIICTTACIAGKIGESIAPRKGDLHTMKLINKDRFWIYATKKADLAISTYLDIFGDRLYLEMMDHNLTEEWETNQYIADAAKRFGIKTVVTNDAHYVYKHQAPSQDYLLRIHTGGKMTMATVADDNAPSAMLGTAGMEEYGHDYYLKSKEELAEQFTKYDAYIPEIIDYSSEIADRCEEVSPVLKKKMYPVFQHEASVYGSSQEQLVDLCNRGLRDRGLDVNQEYIDRLKYELDIIEIQGFADVFLLVWDACLFALKNDIMWGSGRGSGASSLVLWLLGVTFLDPIKEKLIFERFIDVERAEIPDIDTDWEPDRRAEVIEYLRNKYGGLKRVIQIQAFGTLGPRQVLVDLSKVASNDENSDETDVQIIREMSRRITTEPYVREDDGVVVPVTLDWCYRHDKGDPKNDKPSLADLVATNKYTEHIWKCACDMERVPRHASKHAGGVIIMDDDAWNHIPLQKETGADGGIITQFDMNDLEAVGIGKLDILGLTNIGVIAEATRSIRKRPGWENFDIRCLTLDDPHVFQLMSSGNTKGVFQMEKGSFTKCVMEVQPRNFQEVSDVIALFRPGPLGDPNSDEISMKDDYCLRKHGKVGMVWGIGTDTEHMRYIHPNMREILKDTYGMIIYQEQVMKITNVIAGMTRTDGYKVIKAVSKKKRAVLAQYRDRFIDGAIANGYDREWTEKLWTAIEQFAGYSFNMAHSKSYAVLTYWTAYLSLYFTKEFFCAYLNAANKITKKAGEEDKKDVYIGECLKRGIQILPPDINESKFDFTVVESGIRYGLKSIKGIATSAEHIIEERTKNGEFINLEQFIERIPKRKVNSLMVTKLCNAGAFDKTDSYRDSFSPSTKIKLEMELLGGAFDMTSVLNARRSYPGVMSTIRSASEDNQGHSATVACMVSSVAERRAHTGTMKSFGVGTVRDDTGTMQYVCFQPIWDQIRPIFKKGAVFVLEGQIGAYGADPQIKIFKATCMTPSGG